jgi:hypothetical protein
MNFVVSHGLPTATDDGRTALWNRSARRTITGLALMGGLLLGAATLSGAGLQVRTNYQALVLYYNPHVRRDGSLLRVKEAYGYRDIDALCADYIKFLSRASGGQVNFRVVARFELDEFPPDNDPEVTFTAENYAEYHSIGYDLFNHGGVNYPTICNDPRFQIVPRVESRQVDTVWVFGPDYTGFWETAMAGQGAYWVNGGAYPEVNCSRRFVIYGFGMASHQGVGFMLENTAHMTENILGNRIASGWPAVHEVTGWSTLDLTNPDRDPTVRLLNDWEFFTVSDAVHWDAKLVAPGRSQAGLSHFPPTACVNYGWSAVRHDFDAPWEMDSYRTYGGSWGVGNGRLTGSGTSTCRAVLYGSHDLPDDRGDYRVPVIVTDADIDAGIGVESSSADAHAGLLLRCSRYDSGEIAGYYLAVWPGQDRVELRRIGNPPVVLASHAMAVDPGVCLEVAVRLRGARVEISLPPNPAPILVCTNLDQPVDGAVGFSSEGPVWFSHLYVTPVITNQAENWRTYPILGTGSRMVTPLDWRGDGQPYEDNDYWFAWWYEHLPKNPGRHEVRDPATGTLLGTALNSWWPYIFDINTFTSPYLPTDDVISPPADLEAPAPPEMVGGTPIGASSIRIEWLEPVDNVGVTRYEILRDGQGHRRTPLRYLVDTDLAPNSTHTYAVRAVDGSGNVSMVSDTVTVTTLGTDGGLRNGDCELGLGSPVCWGTESFKPTSTMTWEPMGSGCHGTRSIGIDAGSDLNDARWVQEVTGLVPNARYLLKGWIKGEGIVLDQGATIGANLCSMGGWDHSYPALTGTFDWTEVQLHLTANSEGRLTIACRLGYYGSLAGGRAWFDDLTLIYAPILSSCVISWGLDDGIVTLPDGLRDLRMVAAGSYHNVALKADGTVVAWGADWSGQCSVPMGLTDVIAVAAASDHSLALTADGRVFGWGDNLYGQRDAPASLTNAIAIATGSRFSVALREDGTVIAWGGNDWGESDVPAGLDRVVAIDAGHEFALALQDDGRLVAWGSIQGPEDHVYPAYVPADLEDVVGMDCGNRHAVALRADGTVVAWGENESGQTNVPDGLRGVIGVAAGTDHSLALKADGTVVAWGGNRLGQCHVPVDVQYAYALAAGHQRSIALVGVGRPVYGVRPTALAWDQGALFVTIPAARGQAYFLETAEELNDPAWRLVRGVVASSPSVTLTDEPVGAEPRFYFVRPRFR